ncbi:MAG: 4Fe-4S dicluster domain-containing protein, partial [bacterium]|nr:4Fe-4S dicluster domain-containing protein [bacterium]
CSRACPTDCITVIPMEDSTGRGIADRVAKVWEVDLVRCMFCGFCQDACPTTAVRLGREYELACKDYDSTRLERTELLEEPVIPEALEGGVDTASVVFNKKEVKVVPDITKKRKNFW